MRPRPAATVDDILASHTTAVRQIAEELRSLIARTIADLAEKANPGWHSITYRHPDAGYVFGIFPFEDRVHLLFEHGGKLDNPAGLLEGGNLKQARYLRLEPGRALPVTEIEALLRSAVHAGALRRAAKPRTRRRIHKPRGAS